MGFGPNELDAMIRVMRDTGKSVKDMASMPVPRLAPSTPLPPENPNLKPLTEDAGITTSVSMAGLEPEESEEEDDLKQHYVQATKQPKVSVRQPAAPPNEPMSFIDLDSGAAVLDGYPVALGRMELAIVKRVVGTAIVRQLRQEAAMVAKLHGPKRVQTRTQKKPTRKRAKRRVPQVPRPPELA